MSRDFFGNNKNIYRSNSFVHPETPFEEPGGSALGGIIDDSTHDVVGHRRDERLVSFLAAFSISTIIGLFFAFFALSIKGGSQPILKLSNPPNNIDVICSPLNLENEKGYEACLHACEPSSCCYLTASNRFSCLETDWSTCEIYHTWCQHLEHKKVKDSISGKQTPDNVCNTHSLLTEEGTNLCLSLCKDYTCCFDDDLGDTVCNVTNAWCKEYGACNTLQFVDTNDGFFGDQTKAKHSIEEACFDLASIEGHTTCQNVCNPARCCFLPQDQWRGQCQRDCSHYEACQELYGEPNNAEPKPDADGCRRSNMKSTQRECLDVCDDLLCCADGACRHETTACSVFRTCIESFPQRFFSTLELNKNVENNEGFDKNDPTKACSSESVGIDGGNACYAVCDQLLNCSGDVVNATMDCTHYGACAARFPNEYFRSKGSKHIYDDLPATGTNDQNKHQDETVDDPSPDTVSLLENTTKYWCSDKFIAMNGGSMCHGACEGLLCCQNSTQGTCNNGTSCVDFHPCMSAYPNDYSDSRGTEGIWAAAALAVFCGGLGAAVGVAISYPLDTMKTKAQVIGAHQNNLTFSQLCERVWKEEGLKGLYSGVRPTVIGEARVKAVSFSANATGLYFLEICAPVLSAGSRVFMSACFAGFFASFIVTPVERIKVMMQSSSIYENEFHCIRVVIKKEGFFGLLCRGLGITLLREIPEHSMCFTIYGLLMETHAAQVLGYGAPLLFGAIAGIASTIPIIPFDKVKTIIQNTEGSRRTKGDIDEVDCDERDDFKDEIVDESIHHASWREVANKVYDDGGPLAFFDGFESKIMRAGVYNGTTFLIYTLLVDLLSWAFVIPNSSY
jgi:mitochondrial ornithine carrier protein